MLTVKIHTAYGRSSPAIPVSCSYWYATMAWSVVSLSLGTRSHVQQTSTRMRSGPMLFCRLLLWLNNVSRANLMSVNGRIHQNVNSCVVVALTILIVDNQPAYHYFSIRNNICVQAPSHPQMIITLGYPPVSANSGSFLHTLDQTMYRRSLMWMGEKWHGVA